MDVANSRAARTQIGMMLDDGVLTVRRGLNSRADQMAKFTRIRSPPRTPQPAAQCLTAPCLADVLIADDWRPHGDSNPGYRRERAVS